MILIYVWNWNRRRKNKSNNNNWVNALWFSAGKTQNNGFILIKKKKKNIYHSQSTNESAKRMQYSLCVCICVQKPVLRCVRNSYSLTQSIITLFTYTVYKEKLSDRTEYLQSISVNERKRQNENKETYARHIYPNWDTVFFFTDLFSITFCCVYIKTLTASFRLFDQNESDVQFTE